MSAKDYKKGLNKALDILRNLERYELEWEWMAVNKKGRFIDYEDMRKEILKELNCAGNHPKPSTDPALSLSDVSNNEVAVCPDWMHKERRKQNDDNFCPICGTDIRQTDC